MGQFANWTVDNARYRYFITDRDRRKRIINKGIIDILDHVGKDTQHRVQRHNKAWYRTLPKDYERSANKGYGDAISLVGYKTIIGDTNRVEVYYKNQLTDKDHPVYGTKKYVQLSSWGRWWGTHASFSGKFASGVGKDISWYNREKRFLKFNAYVDFIETGGTNWKSLGKFPKGRKIYPTYATKQANEWIHSKVMVEEIISELPVLVNTAINMSIKQSAK